MIPIYKTERLELCSLVDLIDEDYPTNYYHWMNDPCVTRFNSWGLFPYTRRTAQNYARQLEDSRDAIAWAVIIVPPFANTEGLIHGPTHIGNVTLQKIHPVYRSAEMAIVIGEKSYWDMGFATEALTALYDHGFNRMNLHRIWSGTAETNLGMIEVFQKLQMKKEGTFKDAMFLSGGWVDIVEYAVLEQRWRECVVKDKAGQAVLDGNEQKIQE